MHLHNPQHEAVCNLPPPLLPEELIVEILLRLPVSSLIKFKCVCNSWKTLISDHQFTKTHLQISTADPSLVTSAYTTESFIILTYPLEPLFENQSSPVNPVIFNRRMENSCCIIIIGSCNGLLCLFDLFLGCAILCNPSIRLISKKSPAAYSDGWIWNIDRYGFGYDQLNDKYKVLVVLKNMNDFNEELTKIYTFGEDSWKTIQNFPYTFASRLGIFVSGTLSWEVYKNDVSYHQIVILSFDLNKETYEEVLLHGGEVGLIHPNLCVWNNCLCMFGKFTCEIVVHIFRLMKDYGVIESLKKLVINPHEKYILKSAKNLPYFFDILFISENGVALLLEKCDMCLRLILYNLNSGELDYPLISDDFGVDYDPHIYHESLVSPFW